MMCKSWDKEKEILVYSEGKLLISKLYALTIKNNNIYKINKKGCSKGFNCKYCHGWKELEYHALKLRTNLCKKGSTCQRRTICPFKHDSSDIVNNKPKDGFVFVKKNLSSRPKGKSNLQNYLNFVTS